MQYWRPLFVAMLLLVVALLLSTQGLASWEVVVQYDTQLRDVVRHHPEASIVLGLIVYVLLSLVPGTTGKAIVFGWLFGFWAGTLLVNVGLTIAAILTFLTSRYFLRDVIEVKFAYYMSRLNKSLMHQPGTYVLTLRLLHVPYTLLNYMLGATTISTTTFWWSTQLGMLPSNIVFVLAGAQMPTLETIANEGVKSAYSPKLAAALLLLAAFPILIRLAAKTVRRIKQDSGLEQR